MSDTVLTDYRIKQLLTDCERGSAQENIFLELLEWRKRCRIALANIAEQNILRSHCIYDYVWVDQLVRNSGCEWFACNAKATVFRKRNFFTQEYVWICDEHAARGDKEGAW